MEKSENLIPAHLLSLARQICDLKNELRIRYPQKAMIREVVPLEPSDACKIDGDILKNIHKFASANSVYNKQSRTNLLGTTVMVYEGDSTNFWLESKKHDMSYQPFYATWLLSAAVLAFCAKEMGFGSIVDVGSGDGRLPYSAAIIGLDSYGIEIDPMLVDLQAEISTKTGVRYNFLQADATRFEYATLPLKPPTLFFISGLPEMGEMLANGVIDNLLKAYGEKQGFCFMGSHTMRSFSRDQTKWGWGETLQNHGLKWSGTITLPTQWTIDQTIDTPYVFATK